MMRVVWALGVAAYGVALLWCLYPLARRRLGQLCGRQVPRLLGRRYALGLVVVGVGLVGSELSLHVLRIGPWSETDWVIVRNWTDHPIWITVARERGRRLDVADHALVGRFDAVIRVGPRDTFDGYYAPSRHAMWVIGSSPRVHPAGSWPVEWAARKAAPVVLFVEVFDHMPAERPPPPRVARFYVARYPDLQVVVAPGVFPEQARSLRPAIRTRPALLGLLWATPAAVTLAYVVFWAAVGPAAQARRTLPRNAWKSAGMLVALFLGGLCGYALIERVLVPMTKALMVFGLRL